MILPMIDVIFLLLLFFVVVTSFEASAKIAVDVPRPDESQARRGELAKQVVVNCEYENPSLPNSAGVHYRLGADPPEPLSVISSRLTAAKLAHPRWSSCAAIGARPTPRCDVIRMVAETVSTPRTSRCAWTRSIICTGSHQRHRREKPPDRRHGGRENLDRYAIAAERSAPDRVERRPLVDVTFC